MDSAIIASAAVGLLAPYLNKMGAKAAEKIGETIPGKIDELFKAIKDKFAEDTDAENVLDSTQKKPDSKGRALALAEVLEEKMKGDNEFTELLVKLISELQTSLEGDQFQQNIKVTGKAGDIYQIGEIKGNDINIGKKPK